VGRILAAVIASLFAGAVALSVALPLVVRGAAARWVFSRATASLCGSFSLGGGHLGWAAIWDLALGRPLALVLNDVQITGPDGRVVFAAALFEATVEVHPRPWRLVIDDALIARGQWRLAVGPGAVGPAAAFLAVPEAGRAACLDPPAARVYRPAVAGTGSISIRSLELQDVDTELDFATWGLSLVRANAEGALLVGGDGPPILFDARDVVAAAGTLRIGRLDNAWTTRVPFDAVAIERVVVAPEAPTDLRLEVAGARTGGARLAGHALFENIFSTRLGAPPTRPPGLEMAARWTGFGAALSRLDAGWRPHGVWAARLDGDLSVVLNGPFTELAVALEADGAGNHLAAHLARGSADLTLALARVDTRWMLDPALEPLFGGFLHGHFNATARLAPTLAGMEVAIADADLRLDRRHAPSGPRHFELRIGGERRSAGATDTLYAVIDRVRLADAKLKLEDLRVDWTGLSARADAKVAFPVQGAASGPPDGPARGTGRPRSQVDAHGDLAVAALEDWIPGGAASGPLRLSATARGTLSRVDFKLVFPPPATVGVFGQRFALPARLEAALVAGVGLDVRTLRLRRVGGGDAEIGGRLGTGGRLSGTLLIHDYPIADLPGLDRAGLPGALGGTLGAELSVSGAPERPTLEGKIDVASLTFDKRRLGDAKAKLRFGPDRGVADATIAPGVTLHATVNRRPRLEIDAKVSLADRALGPWLPAPYTGAPLAATGEARISYADGAPLAADGVFSLTGPGLTGLELSGRARGVDARAHLMGEIDLQGWPSLWHRLPLRWSRYLKSAVGTADVDLNVFAPLGRPRFVGRLRIVRDLVLETPRWPAPITLAAGGQIDCDGNTLSSPGLSIATPGLHGNLAGRAALDPDDVGRSDLALSLTAELDAAHFLVRLPAGASASGQVLVDAKMNGTLGASPGPRIDGQARFDDLVVQPPAALPSVRARGAVEAHGDTLSALGLQVDIAGVGTVTVGRATSPALAKLVSLSPLRIGRLDLPFAGEHLAVGGPSSLLEIPDLDADVRLTGDAQGDLKLAGDLAVAGGSYDSSRGDSRGHKTRASGAWYRALPPHLTLDLLLHGPRKAMRVGVPLLPDVTVDFQCHLVATNRGATLSGHLRGDGAYARAAVTIYDWFTPGDLRRCQIGTP
jgi:hypothetical protein